MSTPNDYQAMLKLADEIKEKAHELGLTTVSELADNLQREISKSVPGDIEHRNKIKQAFEKLLAGFREIAKSIGSRIAAQGILELLLKLWEYLNDLF